MNMNDLYWAAGFIEGEGCFTASLNKRSGHEYWNIRIGAAQNYREPLERLVTLFGGNITVHSKRSDQTCWIWGIHSAKAIGVMMTLWSLLSERRREKISEIIEKWKRNGSYKGNAGERNGAAKITEHDVRRIRKYAWFGSAHWAAELDVSRVLIQKILAGKIWPHVA